MVILKTMKFGQFRQLFPVLEETFSFGIVVWRPYRVIDGRGRRAPLVPGIDDEIEVMDYGYSIVWPGEESVYKTTPAATREFVHAMMRVLDHVDAENERLLQKVRPEDLTTA